ncbi:hypothetical protein JIQ42_08402 [Leishmania sp. Namibia]|uniref:hypothetical protein n=1 Tax=Leishmania sp. Namibia TaxID=2802991 RepID=UPI001B561BF9|nr:hypothetical protein JIQ42_08402 [Leishmania sp. Namibia]
MPASLSAATPPGNARTVPEGHTFHSLPIQTDFEGTTDVHENFTSAMTRDPSNGLWRATLRGRALLGEEVRLPDDYAIAMTTITTNETFLPPSPASASSFPSVRSTAEVDELETPAQVSIQACAPCYVVWEHDKAPTAATTISQWIALARLIHTPSE